MESSQRLHFGAIGWYSFSGGADPSGSTDLIPTSSDGSSSLRGNKAPLRDAGSCLLLLQGLLDSLLHNIVL